MPIVQVSVWEGMTLENKRKTVEGITKVFEGLGVPREAVEIVIYEAPNAIGQLVDNCTQKGTPAHPRYKQRHPGECFL